jgi:hypothetical protein
MKVPQWCSARTLTPRVKGCEGLCGLYFKNILRGREVVNSLKLDYIGSKLKNHIFI